jgi:arylsulfatase A-like enzyme
MYTESLHYYDRAFSNSIRNTLGPIGGGMEGLTQWEVTITELLSGVGYNTGLFGKWHLGSNE